MTRTTCHGHVAGLLDAAQPRLQGRLVLLSASRRQNLHVHVMVASPHRLLVHDRPSDSRAARTCPAIELAAPIHPDFLASIKRAAACATAKRHNRLLGLPRSPHERRYVRVILLVLQVLWSCGSSATTRHNTTSGTLECSKAAMMTSCLPSSYGGGRSSLWYQKVVRQQSRTHLH